jgi:hypothetical protein
MYNTEESFVILYDDDDDDDDDGNYDDDNNNNNCKSGNKELKWYGHVLGMEENSWPERI